MKPASAYGLIVVWLVGGLYVGSGGYVAMKALEKATLVPAPGNTTSHGVEYHGHVFANEQEVLDFIDDQRLSRWFPWVFAIQPELIPLLTCIGLGAVGGAGRLLKVLAHDRKPLTSRHLFGDPMFGAILGVFVVFLAWSMPKLLTTTDGPMRAESLVLLALLGGLFSEFEYLWLERAAKKAFAGKERR